MLVASLILVVGVGPTYFSPSNVVVIKGIVSVSPEYGAIGTILELMRI